MEVVIESSENVPEGGILSIKIGDTKRQAPVNRVGQAFRFACSVADPLPLKVELLAPVAPAQAIRPKATAERFVVAFGSSRVNLVRREVEELKRPTPDVVQVAESRGLPKEKLAMAQVAAKYLEEHNLVRIFQDILHGLLVSKPQNPWTYIEEHIANAKKLAQKKDGQVDNDGDGRFSGDFSRSSNRRGTEKSRSKVDTLLLKLAETQENLMMVMPFLPEALHQMLVGEDLANECRQQFEMLDVSEPKGKLHPEDLIPIIVQLSTANHQSIGADQARKFANVFDSDSDGMICIDEFTTLVQFVMITAYLESEEGKGVVENAQVEEQNFDEFLAMIEKDREKLWDIIPFLPPWLTEHVTSDEFIGECLQQFDALDVDKSGSLEPDELLPVVVNLTQVHQLSIDSAKCNDFVKIFDVHGNGVIQKDEFIEFAQFLTIMSFLSNSEEGQAIKHKVDSKDNSDRAASLLRILSEDPSRVADVFHFLPRALVSELTGDFFVSALRQTFDGLDTSRRGALPHDAIYPFVISVCEHHTFRTTEAHCRGCSEMFDAVGRGSGSMSLSECLAFTRFAIVMAYLEYARDHQDQVLAEMVLGKDRIEQCLEALRSHAGDIEQIIPFLPHDLVEELLGQAFADQCRQDFHALDGDGNGSLDHKELMPIILQLSKAHHFALTDEHARHFVDIFDTRRNGVLTEDEFIDFARFMLIMSYLDTDQGYECSEEAVILSGQAKVEDLLSMLEHDRHSINKVMPLLPLDVFEHVMSAEFALQCHDKFEELDADKNGSLDPTELYPVIVELSSAHPHSVDIDQCKRFTRIFDVHENGVVLMDEFLDLARFLCVMSFMHSEDGQKQMGDALQIMSDHRSVSELLAILKADRRHFSRVVPFLPEDMRQELLGEAFAIECTKDFQQLDTDHSGALDSHELLPIVQSISHAHHLAIDQEHVEDFISIFDDERTGVISQTEFVSFARFLAVMSYLQSEDGKHILHAVGSAPPSEALGNQPNAMAPGIAAAVGHLEVDAKFYEAKSQRLGEENDDLREKVFGLESSNRRLERRLEELEKSLRHATVDLQASRR